MADEDVIVLAAVLLASLVIYATGGFLFSEAPIEKSKSYAVPRGAKPADAMHLPGCIFSW
jgi:hypothetical protein